MLVWESHFIMATIVQKMASPSLMRWPSDWFIEEEQWRRRFSKRCPYTCCMRLFSHLPNQFGGCHCYVTHSSSTDTCGCCSVTFLDRTPIFDRCVIRWASKNKHLEHTCFQEDWSTTSDFSTIYSTFNSRHDWEDLCVQLRTQWTCTLKNHIQIWRGLIVVDASS